MKITDNIFAAVVAVAGCLVIFIATFFIFPGFGTVYGPQIIGGIIAGGMTIFAGWLAFDQARINNKIYMDELRRKNIHDIVSELNCLKRNIREIMSSSLLAISTINRVTTINEASDVEISFADLKCAFEKFKNEVMTALEKTTMEVFSTPYNKLSEFNSLAELVKEILESWGQAKQQDFLTETTNAQTIFLLSFFNAEQNNTKYTHSNFSSKLIKAHNEVCSLWENYKTELEKITNHIADGSMNKSSNDTIRTDKS